MDLDRGRVSRPSNIANTLDDDPRWQRAHAFEHRQAVAMPSMRQARLYCLPLPIRSWSWNTAADAGSAIDHTQGTAVISVAEIGDRARDGTCCHFVDRHAVGADQLDAVAHGRAIG